MSDDGMDDVPGSSEEGEIDFGEGGTQEIAMDSQMETSYQTELSTLKSVVSSYSAFLCSTSAFLDNSGVINLSIPSSILPVSLQSVYGFTVHKNLLEIVLELDRYDWKKKPSRLEILHPTLGKGYVGQPLVAQAVEVFFSPFFAPRDFYKSAVFLLAPPGSADMKKVQTLKDLGYDGNMAENALALFGNNIDEAIDFLKTGGDFPISTDINISYQECPLLFLTLEIVECFLDLSDHCCVCRRELLDSGIKPSACENKLCQFTLTEIGIGNRIFQEIQRDELAADLVFSMFSCAVGTDFLNPAPPFFNKDQMLSIIKRMPPMHTLATQYHNDTELLKGIGEDAVQLLRWVLLSNRSQLISLNKGLELSQFRSANCHMFMSLLSSPLKEDIFRKKQAKFGSMYLWHGSASDRWHSILRNGLVNASGTKLMANGAAHGSGIYFARDSSTSLGYIREMENPYKNTSLGPNFNCIGLCEIAKVDVGLNDNGWCHTLTDDKAVIVRFLLVNLSAHVDVIKNPPKDVPILRDVLEYHANKL